jgi:hypothetical protein
MKTIKFPRLLSQCTTSSHRNTLTRRIPTTAARVWSQVRWTKWRWDRFFSEYFGFPCQFSFYRLLHTHRLSFGVGTISQTVADVSNGLSLTPSQETKKSTLMLSLYTTLVRRTSGRRLGTFKQNLLFSLLINIIKIHASSAKCCSPWASAPTHGTLVMKLRMFFRS